MEEMSIFTECDNTTALTTADNHSLANVTQTLKCRDVIMDTTETIFRGVDREEFVVKFVQTPPLINTNFTMALVYIILLGSALTIGTVGNLLILLASICFKNLRKSGFVFLINLAIADLCVASVADPMCLVAVLKGEAWYNDKPWLCETVAATCLTACFCAFLSLTLATFNRYVFVCHNMKYSSFFTKKTCVILCIVAWVAAFLFEFPNLLGWGDHNFDQKSHQCIWDRTSSFSYTLTVSVGLIGFPLLAMGACYILIFRKIYSTKLNLYCVDINNHDLKKKVWAETVKSSRMLFAIFITFLMFWTPYAIIIAADVQDSMPVALHLFVTMLAHLHSSVNFTIYLICNQKFRRAVLHVVKCTLCRGSLATTSSSDSNKSNFPKLVSIVGSSGLHHTYGKRLGGAPYDNNMLD